MEKQFMNPEERIAWLDNKIAGRKGYEGAGELRDQMNEWMVQDGFEEIERRQFMKDIRKIRMRALEDGVELKYSRGEKRYYYDRDGYSLTGIPVDKDDMRILTQAAAVLSKISGLKDSSHALDQIIEKLALRLKVRVEDLSNKIDLDTVPDLKGIEHLNDILNAIVGEKVLDLVYQPYDEDKVKYRFSPWFLKEYNNRWFAIGLNNNNREIYVVPLDRIVECETLYSGAEYSRLGYMEPSEYFRDIVGVTRRDAPVEVLQYKFKKPRAYYVKTKPLHPSQEILKETRAFIIFQIKVIPNNELESLILSYGDDVERIEG